MTLDMIRGLKCGGKKWCDPRLPMDVAIPGAYKVGGRHVLQPTGRNRDSSLEIEYGPWEYLKSCRDAQTASAI